MTIEAALRAILLREPAIASVVEGRIYLDMAPQGTAYPLLVLELADEDADQDLRGLTNRRVATIGIAAWAKGSAEASGRMVARGLAETIRRLLVGPVKSGEGAIWIDAIDDDGVYPSSPREDGLAEVTVQLEVTYEHRRT